MERKDFVRPVLDTPEYEQVRSRFFSRAGEI